MDNGLWDALHRLLLKVDRLITDKGEKRPCGETPELPPTDDEILDTWKTFYKICRAEKRRIWNLACGIIDNIEEYRYEQTVSRYERGYMGYVMTKNEHDTCVCFYAFAHETIKGLIVIEHRLKSEVLNGSEWEKTFTDPITVRGTPQQAFDWLQINLGPNGYAGSSYAPIE